MSFRGTSSTSQLDSVTWSPAGGSSPVNSGESSSLPTLSRETSSLGTDFSSPYSSGAWLTEPGLADFSWAHDDLTTHTDHDFSWWPDLIPIEEGYSLFSDTNESFTSSYDLSASTVDQSLSTYDARALSPTIQTAQLAADLLQVDNVVASSNIKPASTKKVSISCTKINRKEKKGHECTDCGKVCGRPSDLLRHKQDVHALAEQYYQCEERPCAYNTRRKDKMKEHCRKMHKHEKGIETFATVKAKEHAVDDVSPLAKRQRR